MDPQEGSPLLPEMEMQVISAMVALQPMHN
jgi:hypothetical protein